MCELREIMGYWKEERKSEIIYIRYGLLDYPFIFRVTVMAKALVFLCWGFSSDYAHGVTMMSPFTSEKKQLVSFCSPSGEELRKFAEELRESIAEVNEMEQIHIQCKEEKKPFTILSICKCKQTPINLCTAH